MKLHVMSDLHLDHYRGEYRPSCEDEANTTLILAGDIIGWTPRCYKAAVAWFSDVVTRYKNVLYVAGNHEYYDASWEGAHTIRTNLEMAVLGNTGKEIYISEEFRDIELEGRRFLFGTMWVPEPARGTPNISDATCIKRFKPEVFRRHKVFCDEIDRLCQPTDIVISHHLPTEESIAPQYYHDPYNAWFYASGMDQKILAYNPKLWIHGHTHNPFDYYYKSRTRVLCNPRGYPGESSPKVGQGPAFDFNLVIDV